VCVYIYIYHILLPFKYKIEVIIIFDNLILICNFSMIKFKNTKYFLIHLTKYIY